MIQVYRETPPTETLRHWEHADYYFFRRIFWSLVGRRIDYLQMLQLGFREKDVLLEIDPKYRETVKAYSDYYFALLQVAIKDWLLIKDVARKQGRDFPFENPRELLAEIAKEVGSREMLVPNAASTGKEYGFNEVALTKEQIHRCMATIQKIYKLSETLNKNEKGDSTKVAYFLAALLPGSWSEFIQGVVLGVFLMNASTKNYRSLKNQKPYWDDFANAHKALVKHVNSFKGSIWWRYNRPTTVKGKSVTDFSIADIKQALTF